MTTGAPFSRSTSFVSFELNAQPPSVAMSSGVIITVIVVLKLRLMFRSPSREDVPGV